jgi:hypothetical protein
MGAAVQEWAPAIACMMGRCAKPEANLAVKQLTILEDIIKRRMCLPRSPAQG